MLTPRQKQIKDLINKAILKNGVAPTEREIARRVRISPSTAHEHFDMLLNKGYIEKIPGRARGISISEPSHLVRVPLLGQIAAGQPIEAIQERETIAIPKSKVPPSSEVYALRVIGNSMIDENINDGDIVLVRQQKTAENGQKVVALIDSCEATLKKYYKEKGYIRLQPANKTIEPIIIKKGREISIQGIVIDIIKNEKELQAEELLPQKETKKYGALPLNKIICGDSVAELKKIPDNSIDLVVTSPPYDGIRKYNGFTFDLHATGKEIYRVLKEGGIAAMVIQDQTKNFGKSLTSFKTIVDWVDNAGFKLFETVIYRKYGAEGAWWNKRFRVDHEYMPIFLKGERPRYFNKEPLKIPSKHGGKTLTGGGTRLTNGVRIATRPITINPTKCRGTIWEYLTAGDGTRLKHQHPATFPDKLPLDFIQCFCPENGVVLDPFIGSGTTALAAIQLNRNYIGIDTSTEYCELAKKRLKEEGVFNKTLF
ncbi:MAG: transcriptional repressor LexA [Candidatus Portnoybacteria bacterium]|nr:transcriptional repressor LexA [Candidatus Portnoybacteria bacterium]MDD4982658.1 transcriptional repressor LexA [Candidatus Portnoybacteria bacterium]